jgi:hypothetical protein
MTWITAESLQNSRLEERWRGAVSDRGLHVHEPPTRKRSLQSSVGESCCCNARAWIGGDLTQENANADNSRLLAYNETGLHRNLRVARATDELTTIPRPATAMSRHGTL